MSSTFLEIVSTIGFSDFRSENSSYILYVLITFKCGSNKAFVFEKKMRAHTLRNKIAK